MLFQSLLAIFSLSYVVSQQNVYSDCPTPGKLSVSRLLPPGTNIPPLPELPEVFQSRLECVFSEQNRSIPSSIFYDLPNNQARVTYTRSLDEPVSAIFHYSQGNILYLLNGTCDCRDLKTDANNLFFGTTKRNGKYHLRPSVSALHVSKDNGVFYMGESTVRGIAVNHWQSCLSWPMMQANFTLDYYFSVPSWKTTGKISQIPVRAEVQGSSANKGFHHVYEYHEFKEGVDGSVFEVPENYDCDCLGDRNFGR